MEEEKQVPGVCPKCHEKSFYHNKGISKKNNKPYENRKCSKCQHIEWIDLPAKSNESDSTTKKPKDFYQTVGEMLGEILRIVNEINEKSKKPEYKIVTKSPEEMIEWIKKHPGGIPVLEADKDGGYEIKDGGTGGVGGTNNGVVDVKDIPF